MAGKNNWTRDQLLIALRLYTNTAFGQLHGTNPKVVRLAGLIGRTPSALSMKACNFASLDPKQRKRGIRGLSRRSEADELLWAEFTANSEAVAAAAEEVYDRLVPQPEEPRREELTIPDGPTETLRTVRARRVQRFFAAAVYTSYEGKCALTGLAVRELLNASHIIPWNEDEKRRAHPSNGILLNVLYDRAFDRHLITFDDDLRVLVLPKLKQEPMDDYQRDMVARVEGQQLRTPVQFEPDAEAMRWHRECAASSAR